MNEKQRNYVDRLASTYVSYFTGTTAEAGWHGANVLQKMRDFGGDLPTGGSGADPTESMLREIMYLQRHHKRLPEMVFLLGWPQHCGFCRLAPPGDTCEHCGGPGFICKLGEVPNKYATSLIARVCNPISSQPEVAASIGLTVKQFETRLKKARELCLQHLERIQKLDLMRQRFRSVDRANIEKADEASRVY